MTPLAAVGVTVVFAVLAWQQRWIADDGLIVVREIRQILAGHGPNFNPFQRDEIDTSVLWTWLGAAEALVVGGNIAVNLVVMGLLLSVAGLGFALAGSIRFHRERGADELLVPAGAMVMLAVAVFWDFATSGLETGLSLCWLGVVWWQLTALKQTGATSSVNRTAMTAFTLGLGPLVRPDFALVTVVLGVALIVCVRPPLLSGLGYAATAAALPLGYEIFRAGYYGILVPMAGLTKESSNVQWGRGFVYLYDFYATYWLFVPMAVLCLALAPMFIGRAPDWQTISCGSAPLLSGLLLGIYILRVGGDYMHGRMWLPVTFTLLLPVMVLPLTSRWEAAGLVTLVGWALLTGAYARTPYAHGKIGPLGITDERTSAVSVRGDKHLANIDVDASRERISVMFRHINAAGDRVLVVPRNHFGDQALWSLPLARDRPDRNVLFFDVMGKAETVTPLDTTVVDLKGLATPLAGHLQINLPGRAGHEKRLPMAWVLAIYADPAVTSTMPDTPEATRADVAAARHALGCGDLKELMDSTDLPMTWPRFWTNLTGSVARTSLRIPADPKAAERRFCT